MLLLIVTKLLIDIKTNQPQSPETTTKDTTKGRSLDEAQIREGKQGGAGIGSCSLITNLAVSFLTAKGKKRNVS